MDAPSQILLTLSFLLPAIFFIWAISIFVWGVRSGGNWRNPIIMFEYFSNLFFYRLRYNHQQRRRAYHQSVVKVPAAPAVVTHMSEAENNFFFLHEVSFETSIDLHVINGNEVTVTKREFKKLQEFFAFTSKKTTAHEAFAHHGLDLRVTNAAKRTPVAKVEKSKAD